MAIAQGHVDSTVIEILPVMPVLLEEITPRVEVITFVSSDKILPNDRAPPASA